MYHSRAYCPITGIKKARGRFFLENMIFMFYYNWSLNDTSALGFTFFLQ